MTEGTVVTFYSYKGGVGRTLALANTGAALASWGYRVLCIDWDIEAPGLKHYYNIEELRPGLVELVTDIKDGNNTSWRNFITPTRLSNGAHLDLICAGQQDDSYIDRVQQLQWIELYEECGLAQILEDWRIQWKQFYDFVLIDSRTGVTDIGALCTAHLPDILVALFTANYQSLNGCIEVVERAERARRDLPFDRAALLILPVPSRFDAREEYEQAQKWRAIFGSKLTKFYMPWVERGIDSAELITRTTIPYVAYWSYGEGLPVLEEKLRSTESIRFYFETIAALVAHRLSNTKLLIESSESYINAAVRTGSRNNGYTYDIFLSFTDDISNKARELHQGLENHEFKVFSASHDLQVNIDIVKEFERTLDQSQHAVFLIGREYSSTMEAELRRFAKQALEEETERSVLPISFYRSRSQTLPAIFQRSQIPVAEDISTEALVNLVVNEIKFSTLPRPIVSENLPEIQLALSKINANDPLARLAAVSLLGSTGNHLMIDKIIERMTDSDIRVRQAAMSTIISLYKQKEGQDFDSEFIKHIRRFIQSDNIFIRISVNEILARSGENQYVYNLILLLDNEESEIRVQAAASLGRIGNPVAIDWLLLHLDDTDSTVQSVVEALCQIPDPRAIQGLLERFTSARAQTRATIKNSLLALKDVQVLNFLVSSIGSNINLNNFIISIILESTSISHAAAVEALMSRLEDREPGVRQAAAAALGRLGDPRAVEALMSRLEDREPGVRQAAAAALVQLGDPRAVEALMSRLEDREPGVRQAAAAALVQLGDPRAVEALMSRLEDREPGVRQAAAAALVQLGDPRAVEALMSQLEDREPGVRQAAAAALVQLGDPRVVGALMSRLEDEDRELGVRQAVAEVLGRLGGSRAVEALMSCLEDREPGVRQAAAAALGLLGDPRAVGALMSCLEDREPGVRQAAAAALGLLGDPRAVGALMSCLEDREPGVRQAAAAALGLLGDPRAVGALMSCLEDREPGVRQAAAAALGRLSGPRAVGALMSQLEDREPGVRQAAVGELVRLMNFDRLDAQLLSRDFDALGPWIDPQRSISEEFLKNVSRRLSMPIEEVRTKYVSINERLGGRLKL